MHNTSSEYKQMHNKTISWNDNWILIFICFVGRLFLLVSPYSSFITASFLIQMFKMDKRLFKNWVLRIPHRLRDLLWMVRSWSSVAQIFSWASSSSQSILKVITYSSHEWIPWSWEAIQDGYHYFCILYFCFYRFKLFCILDLHILQLFSQIHLLIYVLPFK